MFKNKEKEIPVGIEIRENDHYPGDADIYYKGILTGSVGFDEKTSLFSARSCATSTGEYILPSEAIEEENYLKSSSKFYNMQLAIDWLIGRFKHA